jgi:iron complex outermembrane recepter protein
MVRTTQHTIFSLLAATLLSASLHADESKSLDPVIVSASEIVERDDIKLSSTTNLYRIEETAQFGTQVLTQKEIDAYAPKDVFDLLGKATGVELTYQGRRSPFSLEIRGGGNITYILDGAILPSSTSRILQYIPLIAIEEIQIIRGSTALSLAPSIGIGASNSGSGQNIGFIVIRTKQPKKTEGLLTTYMEKALSQATANGESLYVGTRLGSTASGLSGYIGGVVSRYERPSEDSWFDGSDAESGMINGGIEIGRFTLNMMGFKSSGRWEFQRGVTLSGALDNSKWYYDPLKTSVFSTDMSMQWDESQTTLFSLFKTDYEQNEINENFANATRSTRRYDEQTDGYSLRHNARFGDTLIQLGGQITNSEGFGPNLSSTYNRYDTTITGYSASIEQKLFNGKVILDGGYRRDVKHINNSSLSAAKDTANNDVDMAPAEVIALGALWKISDMFALNGRYFDGTEGTSGDFDLKTQNGSALHDEKQKRLELSFDANIAPYFRPMLTWFDIDAKNQKTATTTTYTDASGNIYYYYSEADAHRRGIEVAVKGDIAKGTNYQLSWTHMLSNDTTTNGVTADAIGYSSPEDGVSAILSHSWDDYRANLSYKYASGWQTSASPVGTLYADLGDYQRLDANVAKDFKLNGYTLTSKLYGRNLSNDHYATRYVTGYYYDRGRTLGLELSMAF